MDKLFLNFLCVLEGAKTKCKNLHWAAKANDIHIRLDEFSSILSDYQDGLAEEAMGIEGTVDLNFLVGKFEPVSDAIDFIDSLMEKTEMFYSKIPEDYVGIKGETESFIHNINKYKYLFKLCKI